MRDYRPEIRFPLKNRFYITGVAYYAVRVYTRMRSELMESNGKQWDSGERTRFAGDTTRKSLVHRTPTGRRCFGNPQLSILGGTWRRRGMSISGRDEWACKPT
jgi:hypothetical protein